MTIDSFMGIPITTYAGPVFLLFIALEMLAVRFFKQRGTIHMLDDGVSMFMGTFSIVANGAFAFLSFAALIWAQQFQFYALPLTLPVLVACFVLDDLRYYLHHRIMHRCRWAWATHIMHHSSQRISFAVALRQGWTGHFSGTIIIYIPLVLIGFDPLLVLFCGGLNLVFQFFLHTEMVDKLPRWFEAVFNTPSHHRVHHGKNPKYLDTNYAGTLIIWDKMFGTFIAEDADDRPDYGLVKDFETFNPFRIFIHEYAGMFNDARMRGLTLTQRFLYIFAPPGWSHDGSRQTSEDIKREAGIFDASINAEEAKNAAAAE